MKIYSDTGRKLFKSKDRNYILDFKTKSNQPNTGADFLVSLGFLLQFELLFKDTGIQQVCNLMVPAITMTQSSQASPTQWWASLHLYWAVKPQTCSLPDWLCSFCPVFVVAKLTGPGVSTVCFILTVTRCFNLVLVLDFLSCSTCYV